MVRRAPAVALSRGQRAALVELLRTGGTNHEIGRRISTSEEMVKVHLRRVMQKTGASTRTEIVLLVMRGDITIYPSLPPELIGCSTLQTCPMRTRSRLQQPSLR